MSRTSRLRHSGTMATPVAGLRRQSIRPRGHFGAAVVRETMVARRGLVLGLTQTSPGLTFAGGFGAMRLQMPLPAPFESVERDLDDMDTVPAAHPVRRPERHGSQTQRLPRRAPTETPRLVPPWAIATIAALLTAVIFLIAMLVAR
jgi:hypothetical protein